MAKLLFFKSDGMENTLISERLGDSVEDAIPYFESIRKHSSPKEDFFVLSDDNGFQQLATEYDKEKEKWVIY